MADQPQTADDVRAFVEERDIRFVRLWFTDILGQLKSFSINAQELEARGIVERHVIDDTPVRVEYCLTEKGEALEPAVRALKRWANAWL